MEMALDRFDRFLQDKEHNQGKCQLPLAREIFGSHPVAGQELFIVQFGPQCFHQPDQGSGDVLQNGSHPHFAYRSYLLCTYNNESRSISTLNSTAVHGIAQRHG
jgi:hypothetical protein